MINLKFYSVVLFLAFFSWSVSAQELDCEKWLNDTTTQNYNPDEFNDPVVLNNVIFANNSEKLFSSSLTSIDKLVRSIDADADTEILIICHTCNIGSPRFNMVLSKKRALAIKCYLVSKGIDPERIITNGKGPEAPIAENDTKEGRKINERVEIAFAVK